jgi:hypothetical protein
MYWWNLPGVRCMLGSRCLLYAFADLVHLVLSLKPTSNRYCSSHLFFAFFLVSSLGVLISGTSSSLVIAQVPAGSASEYERAEEPRAIRLKVLVLNYDPIYQGKRLHEVLGFNDPRELAKGFLADVKKSTKGRVVFEIVEWRDLDEIYARDDGGIYKVDVYVRMRREGKGWPERIVADYPRILREQKVVSRIDDGSVDEVWIFCDHFFGVWEASMAGPGAFFINGGVYPEVPSVRPFAFYGFNYERGVAEMLHNTAHRIEATMNRTYGEWNLKEPRNNWELFSANSDQSNGEAGVGTCHWPANAQSDYDYANRREVMSYADAFLKYPDLKLVKKPVSARTWSRDGVDPHRAYMNWYLERLPKAAGVNADGKLNNWYPYIFDFQNYDRGGKPQPNSLQIVKTQCTAEQFAAMVSFSTAAAIDPTGIKPEFASLRVGETLIEAERIHLVTQDSGTYRTASFVFPLPPGLSLDNGIVQVRGSLVMDQSLSPFTDCSWELAGRNEELTVIPKTAGLETPLEVATWILKNGGKLGVKGKAEWIDREAELARSKAAEVERIYWWREGTGAGTLKWYEVSAFQVFDKLRELELRGQPIGDRGCELLSRLEKLEVLNLHACGLSDEGLVKIAQLPQLVRLDIGYSQGRISDAGAGALSRAERLEVLNIYDSSVTDKFLSETVTKLKMLEEIELTRTRVTEEGVRLLQQANPRCRVTKH